MFGIPDWGNEPMTDLEAIAAKNAAIDAELADNKLIVLDEDVSVHRNGTKCGDSTCPCATDDAFI